ncbi:hypothetical protein MMC14_008409 [Varicellaria rhodocarpa]|nr:hypothetical protein [Varicellaria rhodocarpa]
MPFLGWTSGQTWRNNQPSLGRPADSGSSEPKFQTKHDHAPEDGSLESLQVNNGDPHTDLPPDGGTTAWLVVLGGWCCYLSSYGWLSSIGVFQTYYEQNTLSTYSASTISWIVSVQVFILSGMAPVNGKIFDGYGSNALLWTGTFLHIFGIMMLSLSTQYYQIFLAQSLCSGIGAAMIFHAATNAVATWFQKRRGLALGLASSGSSIGGVIMP